MYIWEYVIIFQNHGDIYIHNGNIIVRYMIVGYFIMEI